MRISNGVQRHIIAWNVIVAIANSGGTLGRPHGDISALTSVPLRRVANSSPEGILEGAGKGCWGGWLGPCGVGYSKKIQWVTALSLTNLADWGGGFMEAKSSLLSLPSHHQTCGGWVVWNHFISAVDMTQHGSNGEFVRS